MEALLNEKEKTLILNGSIKTVFLKLAIPSLIGMVLFGLNNFLDGIFVGHFINGKALAGVSLAFSLSQITIGIANMIGNGAGTVLSIMIGANNTQQLQRLVGNANTLVILFSLLLIIPSLIFAEPLMRMMGGSGEILAYGTDYFRHITIGAFFWIHSLALTNIIRGEGKLLLVTLITAAGLVFDVIMKYIFIKVLNGGIEGAAWATNCTMLLYSLISIFYFATGKATFRTKLFVLHFDKSIMKQMLLAGFSSFIFLAMGVIQGLIVFNMLAKYGTEHDMTVYSAAFRVFMVLMMPSLGIMKAMQPVIGMNYGAKQYERVRKTFRYFLKVTMYIVLPVWIFLMLFPQQILETMLGESCTATDIFLLRTGIASLLIQPVIMLSFGMLPSVGKGKESGIVAMLQQVVLYIPAMLILPAYFGIASLYWTQAGLQLIAFAIVMMMVMKEFKRLSAPQELVAAMQ